MKMPNFNQILILPVLVLIFILTYSPHFNYPLPIHGDEWNHIGRGLSLFEGRVGTHPYFETDIESVSQTYGLRFFVAGLHLAGVDVVWIYQFLPAIFFTIAAFVLYFLLTDLTKNKIISILGVLILAATQSSQADLGPMMFTSLSFAIPFFFLSLWSINKGRYWLFAVFWFVTFWSYPVAGMFVFFSSVFFLWRNRSKRLLMIVVFMLILNSSLYFLIQETFYSRSLAYSSSDILIYLSKDYSIKRMSFYFYLTSIPLIIGLLNCQIKKRNYQIYKKLNIGHVIYIAITIFLITSFYGYKVGPFHYLFSVEEFQAVEFLKTQESGKVVLADRYFSLAIYPTSKNYVVASLQGNLVNPVLSGPISFDPKTVYKKFLTGDTREEIIEHFNISYVFSRTELNEKYLEKVFDGRMNVYKIV